MKGDSRGRERDIRTCNWQGWVEERLSSLQRLALR